MRKRAYMPSYDNYFYIIHKQFLQTKFTRKIETFVTKISFQSFLNPVGIKNIPDTKIPNHLFADKKNVLWGYLKLHWSVRGMLLLLNLPPYRDIWSQLDISYNYCIRCTSSRNSYYNYPNIFTGCFSRKTH